MKKKNGDKLVQIVIKIPKWMKKELDQKENRSDFIRSLIARELGKSVKLKKITAGKPKE